MTDLAAVNQYHDRTKHYLSRFARSLGYLDWASQPAPFRSFAGAGSYLLYPAADRTAGDAHVSGVYRPAEVAYDDLFGTSKPPPSPLSAEAIGDLLRHALGLSAWKQFRESRWSLRVNPSSGNLHPTESYIVCPALPGLAGAPSVYHYAPDRHSLELRCELDEHRWRSAHGGGPGVLVALTSIHWRESWKYGERAFRYRQHDLGHAIAALRLSAAMLGWRAELVPQWAHRAGAALTGIDRPDDFIEVEPEEPGCVLSILIDETDPAVCDPEALVQLARDGRWSGRASRLSRGHVHWSAIDDVARATEDAGRSRTSLQRVVEKSIVPRFLATLPERGARPLGRRTADARKLVLKRRSALAFDGVTSIDRSSFQFMLSRVMPSGSAPWDAVWWPPRIDLAIFVHRVDGVEPGLYLLARDPDRVGRLRSSVRVDFEWTPADEELPLFRLGRGDCRRLAERLSCDQEIAADGFFSLAMIADFEKSLEEFGPPFYRNLFWESGIVGQVLYLEAEVAGARATGIGCYYDDPVHDVLGLEGRDFQSLYHFTVGMPIEDPRLTTEPGYSWEQ